MELSGRVALVTGGSRGIGRAIALKLASEGAHVAVNFNQNQLAAEEVVAAAKVAGVDAIMVQGDIGTREGAEAAVKATVERWNRLDILVNNAGITRDQLIMRLSEEDWDAVLDTNLKGAYLCSKLASRHMLRARWGRIINISSVVGQMGNAGQANYAASKAGLLGLTKSLAREFASKNITANAVAPGWIETDIVAGLSEEARQYVLGQIPLGRYGKPE
ncbi:MAG: 3-oxoacyl-ACP reductase FabG, partial [Chloroflexia bacterium]|nr:3-oxoacyl-ACP reductase FabG [Chloroflexia bacterium]